MRVRSRFEVHTEPHGMGIIVRIVEFRPLFIRKPRVSRATWEYDQEVLNRSPESLSSKRTAQVAAPLLTFERSILFLRFERPGRLSPSPPPTRGVATCLLKAILCVHPRAKISKGAFLRTDFDWVRDEVFPLNGVPYILLLVTFHQVVYASVRNVGLF